MITAQDILTSSGAHPDREGSPECTPEVRANAEALAPKVTKLLECLGLTTTVSSGFRTAEANAGAGGAKHSNHMLGNACDLHDPNNTIDDAIMKDPAVLEKCELYLESPQHTPGWAHVQQKAPASGHRVFIP